MGIHERRVAPGNMLPSDMAVEAAREAMQTAGNPPTQIDAIIYAGVDRDYLLEPATAHVVQDKIGAYNAVAFDVTNACHGFMNGIHLMDALIATGKPVAALSSRVNRVALYTEGNGRLSQTKDRKAFLKLVGGLTLGDAGAARIMGQKLGPESDSWGSCSNLKGSTRVYVPVANAGESPLETDMTDIVEQNRRLHSAMYKEFMVKLRWRSDQIAKFVHHQVGKNVFRHHAQYVASLTVL